MALSSEFNISDQIQYLSEESSGKIPYGEIVRDYVPKPGVKWRFGRPNYARVNKAYFEGRTKIPRAGSAEELVTKVVKNWEVDSHHVAAAKDWATIDVEKFRMSVNCGPKFDAQYFADRGPYNSLLEEMARGYSGAQHTCESANKVFSECFPKGFAFEVLEVYSGPPKVSFKFRHWGEFCGVLPDKWGQVHVGDGRVVNFFGFIIATLNTENLIEELELFFNPDDQIAPCMACPVACVTAKGYFDFACCSSSK